MSRAYFGGWTGYGVPLRPFDPIDYQVAEGRPAFTVFERDEKGRVVSVEKYLARVVKADPVILGAARPGPGVHYFAVEDDLRLGRPLALEETRAVRSYYRVRVSQGGAGVTVERVERERMLRHRYVYAESGILAEARYDADNRPEHVQRFDAKGEPLGPPVAS